LDTIAQLGVVQVAHDGGSSDNTIQHRERLSGRV
jgi:hypothetical protein